MATASGHDSKGRFTKGNRCGRGRKVTELRRALAAALTVRDMTEIAARLVAMAKQGDLEAVALLFERVLGKPMSAMDTELYTFEYDRDDYQESDMERGMEMTTAQIRPLEMRK